MMYVDSYIIEQGGYFMPEEILEKESNPRSNQKLKIIYLMKILMEETDETHDITLQEIVQKLNAYGVTAERKSLYNDIENLRLYGIDIEGVSRDRTYYYKVVNRDFELPELKLLIDAVLCSKFITAKQSQKLINKLKGYVSRYEAIQMQRQVYVNGRVKSENERSFYSVDTIYEAIADNHKISFTYFHYDMSKQKTYAHDKKVYTVSPWAMCWDDEKYYLIAYDDTLEEPSMKHFRVDKMEGVEVLRERRKGNAVFAFMDMSDYTNRMFGMFSGDVRKVELICKNDKADIVFDRFGLDIPVVKVDDDHFKTKVDVAISDLFFGWIMAIPDVKIIGPSDVVDRMREMIEKKREMYQ